MTSEHEIIAAPRVRSLTRWGVPFHYLPPLLVAAGSLALLSLGGIPGYVGGWCLAVVLPITIGAFLRNPWFALGPVIAWGGWLVVVASSPSDAALSNTRPEVGISLGLIGVVATLVMQRAVFPATTRAAWSPAVKRMEPVEGFDPDAQHDESEVDGEDSDEHELHDELIHGIDADDDELKAAGEAAEAAARAASEVEANEAEPTVAAPVVVVPDVNAEANAVADPTAAEPDAEGSEAVEAAAEPEPEIDDAEPESAEAEASETEADQPEAEEADEPTADAKAADAADADAPASVPHLPMARPPAELPLDADPAPLDEGGHVTEFEAISEEDVLAAAQAQAAADQAKADADVAADDAAAAAEMKADDEAAAAASLEAEAEAKADAAEAGVDAALADPESATKSDAPKS